MKRELNIITHYGNIIFASFVKGQIDDKVYELLQEISGLVPKDYKSQIATLNHDGYEIEVLIVESL